MENKKKTVATNKIISLNKIRMLMKMKTIETGKGTKLHDDRQLLANTCFNLQFAINFIWKNIER